MNILNLLKRARDFFRRPHLEQDLESDLRFHVDELSELYRAQGMTPAEANLAARRELGNITRIREDYHEQAGFPLAEELWRDFSLGMRNLSKRPLFAFGVLFILVTGLTLATVVQGLGRAILLRPLPVAAPEELHLVTKATGAQARLSRGTLDRIVADLGENRVVAVSNLFRPVLRLGDHPATNVNGQLVAGNSFQVLGVKPIEGRLLTRDDDRLGNPSQVAVVSERWARNNFGTPKAALGVQLQVNTRPVVVVGVLPESFQGLRPGRIIDLWMPAAMQRALSFSSGADMMSASDRPNNPDWNLEERVSWLSCFLRLHNEAERSAAGMAVQKAYHPHAQDLATIVGTEEQRRELLGARFGLTATPGGQSDFREAYKTEDRLLWVFVVLLLCLTCANLSGLMLVRSLSRQKEIGLRLALGAKRWRIFLLFCSETLVICLAGCVAALFLSHWLLPLGAKLLAPAEELGQLQIDPTLIATSGGIALLLAVLCSTLPSMILSRQAPQNAILGRNVLGRSPMLLGRVLVILQLCFAVLFASTAFSLGRKLSHLMEEDAGFSRERVLCSSFSPNTAGYKLADLPALRLRLDAAIRQIPGVTEVAFASDGLVTGSQSLSRLFPRGDDAKVRFSNFQGNVVDPSFFAAAGIRQLSGRAFTEADNRNAPGVVLISRAMALQVFGSEDVVGRHFGFTPEANDSDLTVIGVIADSRINGLKKQAPAVFFLPRAQWEHQIPIGEIIVRIAPEGPEPRVELQKALSQAEPGIVFGAWRNLEERLAGELAGDLAGSRLSLLFASIAILLATTGMATLAAYLVTQRKRDYAIRIALGEQPTHLLRSVVQENAVLALFGIALGLVAAWSFSALPAIASRLPAVPGLFSAFAAAFLCLCACVLAVLAPAFRATRNDPLSLLRSE